MTGTTNQQYVYKWTHLPTLRWYVGSRTSKRAHPADGYICSSKIVKPLIENNPSEWLREIVYIGAEAYEFETMILQLFDAKNDPRSFNGHNNDGKFSTAGIPLSKERCEYIRKMRTGKKSASHSIRVSGSGNPMYGTVRNKHSDIMTGSGNPRYLGAIVGTNIETGQQITLIGSKALRDAGFQHSHVYRCINGLKRQYKGYTWCRNIP